MVYLENLSQESKYNNTRNSDSVESSLFKTRSPFQQSTTESNSFSHSGTFDRSKTDAPWPQTSTVTGTLPGTTLNIWDLIGRQTTLRPENIVTTTTQGFLPGNLLPTTSRTNFGQPDPTTRNSLDTRQFASNAENRFENLGFSSGNLLGSTTQSNTYSPFKFHTETIGSTISSEFATRSPINQFRNNNDKFGSLTDSRFGETNNNNDNTPGNFRISLNPNGEDKRVGNFETSQTGANNFGFARNNFGTENSGTVGGFPSAHSQNGFNREFVTSSPSPPPSSFNLGETRNFPNQQFAGTNIGSNSNSNGFSNWFNSNSNQNPQEPHSNTPQIQPGNSGSDVFPIVKSQSVCSLPSQSGPCRAAFRRFFFDGTTGDCKEFMYGGCEGNENNFRTIEECQKICAKGSNTGNVVSSPLQPGE